MKTNRIKIVFATLLAVLTLTFAASAQDRMRSHDPETMAKKQTEMMKTELGLSPEQLAKVESINLKYATKGKEQRDAMHQQMKSLREEKDKDLASVLNKDQIEKYNKLKADQKSKRMQCRKGCTKKNSEKK